MKVLITGGAGYLGTELTYRLAEHPKVEEIVIYDNLSRGNHNLFIGQSKLNDKLRFIEGELLDSRKLNNVIKDIDVVYHLAAMVSTPFADQNPHLFEQVNHWGTAELIYAVEQSNVQRFIYMSSISALGASEHTLTEESHPNPKTFYGISKLRGENHVERLAKKVPCHILRCGNVYGYSKSMRFDAVINRFMFEANFKNRININGTGEQHRSFVHVDKVTDILENILEEGTIEPGKYLLVDRVMSVNEIVDNLRELFPSLETLFINQHLRLREVKAAPSKALMELVKGHREGSFLDELERFKEGFAFHPAPD